jgi:glutamate dehydrogenase
MARNGVTGTAAVEMWVAEHLDEVERIRAAIFEIADTGLTLAKLSVAASLLGDLVKP